MARYAFDLDGTLWVIPGIAVLARDLIDDGHKIYIITGNPSKDEIQERLDELKLKPHKIIQVPSSDLHTKGEEKGREANKHGISIFFEDKQDVMVGFAGTSRIARGYCPNDNNLQPTKARQCICLDETRSFIPQRCMHCTEFFESLEHRTRHTRLHHPEEGD